MSYPLTALYYRLMGARVGRRTRIAPGADLGEFDLLDIGDDACIDESAIVRPSVLEGSTSPVLRSTVIVAPMANCF